MIAGMNDRQADSDARGTEEQREASQRPAAPAEMKERKRANMHEGIGVWCDCCSCEAEPRWVEVAEELGIDLSDYEDEGAESP
jgi:hypothetical protein